VQYLLAGAPDDRVMSAVAGDNGRMRRLGPVALAFVMMLGAASCTQSTYRFISNGAEQVSLKLPRSWTTYPQSSGIEGRLAPDSPGDVKLLWSVGFDASPTPSKAHLAAVDDYGKKTVDHPVGVVSVYQVQGGYNQKLSLTEARSAPLGVDPMYVSDSVKSLVEIVKYEPAKRSDGLQGSHVVFNLRSNGNAPWSTYDMRTYFDQGHYRMYTLIIGCLGPCFEQAKNRIAAVSASWRIKP